MRQSFDPPSGLYSADTTFAAKGKWASGSNVRFWAGKAQQIGGWESLQTTLLTGVCRKAFPWTDNTGQLNIAFGTHSNLQVNYGGTLYDITPTLQLPETLLGTNPLTTANTTTTVTVAHPHHGLATGASVSFSGATTFNNVTISGAYTITVVDANSYTITAGTTANASSAGGGSAVVAAPQTAFVIGAIDGTGTSGYGTGGYGVGGYGSPSTADYFPRTWSTGAWGQNLLACPRGGAIHAWTNNTGTPAAPLQNAPAQVTHMVVAPNGGGYQVFALGCSQEADGVFNPMCLRHCSVRNNTEWNTSNLTTAREYVLTGGGRIVAGVMLGPDLMVFTNKAIFRGSFVGDLSQPWHFDQIAEHCGLIGPNAAVVLGEAVYWMSPDKQFWTCPVGGYPIPIECEIRPDFADNLAPSQGDKIAASTCAEFYEVRWDYPDIRDGIENSRYIALCTASQDAGKWYAGIMARTAYVDAGPSDSPIGVTFGGNAYWHERGASADGSAMAAYIESADLYLDETFLLDVTGIWPDFQNQQGAITLSIIGRLYPQDANTVSASQMMAVGAQKADFRLSARLFRVRVESNAAPSGWRIGKLDFEYARAGLR